jgi:hypothetical protein
MPNHCENDLYLRGPSADVAAVLAHIGADQTPPKFDFNTLIPYPEPFKSMDDDMKRMGLTTWPAPNDPERAAKLAERSRQQEVYKAKWGTMNDGYNSGGYGWCCAAWGTKWNAYEVARRDYDGWVCVTFQTAWAPPRPVIVALATRFPTVTFQLEYFEHGMSFAGGFECPCEDDYWDEHHDTPWQPGIVVAAWETREYRGHRGG